MNIGLIAHDSKKNLMQNFCIAYYGILSKHRLKEYRLSLIEAAANLTVHKYLAGPLGGEQQLSSAIENNEMDLVIFLRDPMHPKSGEPKAEEIMKKCDAYNIPVASNLATAELMIKALERGDLEWRENYK